MPHTEEQALIRDAAKRFAAERLAPFAAQWDREHAFPAEAVAELGALGLLGMLVPDEWGGGGAGYLAYAMAVEEIAAGDGSVSTIMCVQNTLIALPLLRFASEAQKKRLLGPVARGEMLGCFCLTEPQAGSDAGNLKTRARRDGNGWVLSGTKQFITSGARADLAVVFAVSEPKAGKDGISAFLVPTDIPGYSVARVEDKLGQNASDTAQVVFDALRVEGDALLGDESDGYRIALSTLEGGRIGIAAQAVGMARAAYEAALAYAQEREAFGKPIIGHQAVAFRLADMATGVEAARQLTHHAATLADSGQPCRKEAAMAKLFASEMAEKVCSDAIQVHGGYGYLKDFPVERIWRDVRVCRIYEGTSDIQRLIISREIADQ
ncbi:MAG: acyl-CoA dehydrogenase family protein [Rhodospirillales bacterium]|jgi:alkylation response protein AidB-like acyl-CoA dehydrogenase|nr:acyl-CoA dehydrogenase family protein [Rhodospirillales bacterium]